MKVIKVPSTPGPTKQLCYQTPPLDGSRGNPMVHCDRAINHGGRHSWEIDDLVFALVSLKRGSCWCEVGIGEIR